MALTSSTEIEAAPRRLEASKYIDEVDFSDIHLICKALREAQKDTTALDCLSDPKFEFSYKIGADRTVTVDWPCCVRARTLRSAVAYVIDYRAKRASR